jgi:hypothetical protein
MVIHKMNSVPPETTNNNLAPPGKKKKGMVVAIKLRVDGKHLN